ncbi:Protein CBG22838 [Caenorhabditis briggsae]|uniref:Protein CBG22838 n=1 Tax=Caenorhabditis briggsae TaxID=6238 RepID=A8Y362_CAEBR|nr:Protein CBG22838 [Caenorhabditis briggsae]CAP39331.2 Protein CBG22838 [Caenorhabditis briggsae]
MNQTDDVSQHSNVSIVFILTTINSNFTLLSCLVLYYPVFPIFVYVFWKNRDQEKDSNVFPILQHFYRTTTFEFFFLSVYLTALIYQYLHPEYTIENPTFALIISKWYDFQLMFFEIHHLIIILLAVQRFILYFELLVNVNVSPKAINIILFMLYFVGYLKLAFFEVWIEVFKDETMNLIYQKMLIYESIVIHVLMFASAILYIPISVSIRRKAHLVSIIKNKPNRFILYQTIGLCAFKVVSAMDPGTKNFNTEFIQTSLRLHIFDQFELENSLKTTDFYGNHFDFVTTPVMIQMSYLFSNKRNLDTIKNIFKRKNLTVPSISRGESQSLSTRSRGLFAGGVNRVAQLVVRSPIV